MHERAFIFVLATLAIICVNKKIKEWGGGVKNLRKCEGKKTKR